MSAMSPARKARKRVLVVEDDRALNRAVCGFLVKAGFTVVSAADGIKALEELRRQKFDLMLLDLGLPGMGGLEVLACVRDEADSPRVVVMTADDTPETLLRAVRDQAYEYLAKPFAPRIIGRVVKRALAATSNVLPIEVISARPEWVELRVPCALEVAERIQGVMHRLEADLPEKIRESVGQAFRELLLNAI